jgi:hypothetical protein
MTIEERKEKLMRNGITPEDLKRSYENGYRHGFAEASPATFKIIYAAVCLVLNKMHGFGMKVQGRIKRRGCMRRRSAHKRGSH